MALRGTSVSTTLTSTLESAALVTIDADYAQRRGVTYFVNVDQAGTAKVYYEDPNGNEREMVSRSFTANTLLVIDVDFRVPRSLIKITPDAQPAVVDIEGVEYG